MRFVVGCDLEGFKRYAKRDGVRADVAVLEIHIEQEPSSVIVSQLGNEIIGHAIWHETSTEEHRKGAPRGREDREVLERLLGGTKEKIVELHELWLIEEYRGRGYWKRFFEFFEEFMSRRSYDSIVYYADHPAALAICRKREYKEDYVKQIGEYVFHIPVKRGKPRL